MHLLAFAETIQLFPDGTLFLHIVIILLMIWVLNRTLYRPINSILDSRERNKGGHSTEAAEILNTVSEKEQRYNKELLDARSKGYELVEKEQKKAIAAREQKIAEAKTEVAGHLDEGKAELDKQAAEAHAAIDQDAEMIADKIAASILKG